MTDPRNELTPAGADIPVPAAENSTNYANAEALPAPAEAPVQPNQADRKPLPRWFTPVVAGAASLAVAVTAYAASPREIKEQLKSRFIPGYAASAGEQDARRARIVGLNLDLDGVSDENITALLDGDDSVVTALRGRLASAYGEGVDFDFYYSLTTEDGDKEYVPFIADAEEDNADEAPKDTITLPMNGITGNITPDNRDEVINGLFGQIIPQLDEWDYKPAETTTFIDPTTGEEITIPVVPSETETAAPQPVTTGGTKPPVPATSGTTRPPSTAKPTEKPTTQKPNTTTKPEGYTPPQTLRLSPNQVVNGNFEASFGYIDEDYNKANPMKIEITTEYGTVLAVKRPYAGVNELVMDFYVKDSNGEYVLKKAGVKDLPDGSDGMCYILLVGARRENGNSDNYYKDAWGFGYCGTGARGGNSRYDYTGHYDAGIRRDADYEKRVFAEDLF
jgi:hypothetical protein